MKVGIVDIGSNSVRFAMIADGKTLYKKLRTTRLGEGLSNTGRLCEGAICRTAEAVEYFKEHAKQNGADKFYAFATAAVRSSSNGGEFLGRVKEQCGVVVDVLSGEEEAAAGLLGALKGRDGGIIDVGGASSEVTMQRGGKTFYAKSIDIGTVRLFDLAGRDIQKLRKVVNEKISEYGDITADVPMYAIGGTATTIAAVKHGLKTYDASVVDGTCVTYEEADSLAERLICMSVEEVKKIDGMEPRRADIIGGGCLLLGGIMKKLKIDCVTVSESDNIEGYYLLKEGKNA